MTPPRARLGTVGFVLGTHDFHQAVKPAKTLGHFRMKIQQDFVVRRQAWILRQQYRRSLNQLLVGVGMAMGHKVLGAINQSMRSNV